MKQQIFFSQHPVFTVEELEQYLSEKGSNNPFTRNAILSYYRKQGRIVGVRRGLYIVVPYGSTPDTVPVDPYLLAIKMTRDAVLGYHSALGFYGKAYSVVSRFHYLSKKKSLPVKFRFYEFHGVSIPKSLCIKGNEMVGVTEYERSGMKLKVTSFERTLVDVLDRPELTGSWEEVWRSLESVEFFDIDQVVNYVMLLEKNTTAAKVGFFLWQHREKLMVEENHFKVLRELAPRQPYYLDHKRKRGGIFLKDWNLIVPNDILNRTWAEIV